MRCKSAIRLVAPASLGAILLTLAACMTGVVIPWGQSLVVGGKEYPLQITDINVGILYVFGVVSIGVYGIMIGGWASVITSYSIHYTKLYDSAPTFLPGFLESAARINVRWEDML